MTARRACFFVVADKNTEYAVRGFLQKPSFHLSLACSPFEFDPRADLIVAAGANDPGLYTRAEAYARGPLASHAHLDVILDAGWQGSPGAPAIRSAVEEACARAGWSAGDVCVAVIEPEVENWVWLDHPVVEEVVGHASPPSLRAELATSGGWPADAAKPPRPKETLEAVLRQNNVRRSSSLYQSIASRVSVGRCTDPAFLHLAACLRRWYPA